ncbi:hypothetical protein [Buttiauxella sp. S19-1]|uniref:hypothetical protein n=1 Tax=Buttiauxella sp. S19-1 TaxID=941430 RepID=UPI001EDB9DEC|nr:hypothetical protein [Buttiauxella sp. S19-1]
MHTCARCEKKLNLVERLFALDNADCDNGLCNNAAKYATLSLPWGDWGFPDVDGSVVSDTAHIQR